MSQAAAPPEQPSPAAVVMRAIKSTPLGVRIFLAINIAVYLFESFIVPMTQTVCLLPHQMLTQPLSLYRIFTAPFFHLGLLHLLFNMLALYSLGSVLEKHLGTAHFVLFVLGTGFCTGLLSILISALMRSMNINECSVGFSGIIFAMLSYQSMANGFGSYNFWGIDVPAKVYPWILLLFTQIFMPGVSLLVHFCGLLAGYIWYFATDRYGTAYIALIETKFSENFPRITEWSTRMKSDYSLLPTTDPKAAASTSNATGASPTFPGKGYRLGGEEDNTV